MSIIRTSAVLFGTVALAVSLTTTATAAQPAQAAQTSTSASQNNTSIGGAYGCSGTLVEQDAMYSEWGTLYGYVDLYWDGTNNCAVAVHAPGYQNDPLPTFVNIESWSTSGPPDDPYEYKYDKGTYSSYAGPVSVFGAGRCVEASGDISGAEASTEAHCG